VLEHPVGELRRDADAVGEVLAVEDAEVGAQLLAQAAQSLFDRTPARDADDVGNEKDSQGRVSVAAGRSSIEA
jgi:hypothetical protein